MAKLNMQTIKIWIITTCLLLVGGGTFAQRGGVIGVTGVVLPGTAQTTGAASDTLVVQTVQRAINRILGLLAFIALIILLYAGFLMLTAAGNDDQYNKGFTILKQVALGLVFIGLAWIVVSMIFWIIGFITTP